MSSSPGARRSKLADAVEHLLAVVAFIFRIGAFFAEASVLGSGRVIIQLRRLMRDGRARTRKSEAVHRRVCVANESQGLIERGLASLVNRFAEQKNGASIICRLSA